jgi:carbon monoxide dehydrogenase subunit G
MWEMGQTLDRPLTLVRLVVRRKHVNPGQTFDNDERRRNEMARYTGTVEAPHSAEEVWDYLADMRSVEEWDPSVEEVELVGGQPRTEGARYDLEVRFRGRSIKLPYRVVEVDRPHRVVFEAETDALTVRDEARIEPTGPSASSVTWDADLQLRGIRRLLDLPLRAFFHRLGEDARNGLGERLCKPQIRRRVVRVRG